MINVWCAMKKSNKISVFYILTSIALFLILAGGGAYGIYVSFGLNYMSSTFSNVAGGLNGAAQNVGYVSDVGAGNKISMTGITVLSLALIVLALFDFVSMIKQIVFFKQFNIVKNSTLEQVVEKKNKSKKSVIVFAFLIDVLSFIVGVVGLFINARTLPRLNYSWVLYFIDGFVCLFAVISIVLLIVKLKKVKQNYQQLHDEQKKNNTENKNNYLTIGNNVIFESIDKLEYCLLKLKHLKSSKMISTDEYAILRGVVLGSKKEVELENKNQNKIEN